MMNKSKLIYQLVSVLGIGIAILTIFILYLLKRDLNDQNEILLYALSDLIHGINPYTQSYEITNMIPFFVGDLVTYTMFYGYTPLSLILYLPIMIHPQQYWEIQFQPILFVENMIFLYLAFQKVYKQNPFLGCLIWLNPLCYLGCYVGFVVTYTFPLFCLMELKNPLKCGMYLMASIMVYQLWIFLGCIIICYQCRILKEPLSFTKKMHILTLFILGMLLLAPILVFFLIWDAQALIDSLFYSSVNRFGINYFQYGLIGLVCGLSTHIFLTKSTQVIKILHVYGISIYIIEDIILNLYLNPQLHHYLLLILPIMVNLGLFLTKRTK